MMRFDSEAQKKGVLDLFSLISIPGSAPASDLLAFALLKQACEHGRVLHEVLDSTPVRAMDTPADPLHPT